MSQPPSNILIPYYRVSTKQQGQSGLGLEGQKAAVEAFAKQVGGRIVLPPFVEVESGKNSARPELARALETAKLYNARLVVAKLDRLSRNVAFLSTLMESGVPVYFCDIPSNDRFQIHIMVAVAEKEALDISNRTKAALAAYKARGGKLGGQLEQCRNLTTDARQKGTRNSIEKRHSVAMGRAQAVSRLLKEWMTAEQKPTLQQMADRLTEMGLMTSRGKRFGPVQVKRILDTTA